MWYCSYCFVYVAPFLLKECCSHRTDDQLSIEGDTFFEHCMHMSRSAYIMSPFIVMMNFTFSIFLFVYFSRILLYSSKVFFLKSLLMLFWCLLCDTSDGWLCMADRCVGYDWFKTSFPLTWLLHTDEDFGRNRSVFVTPVKIKYIKKDTSVAGLSSIFVWYSVFGRAPVYLSCNIVFGVCAFFLFSWESVYKCVCVCGRWYECRPVRWSVSVC